MTQLYSLSEKKSSRPNSYWIIETDAATGQANPPHLSTSAFSDGFYKRFKKDNNVLVKYASKFGIDLGEEYSKFYETGFRVSQQLDGRVRDRTFEQYGGIKDSVVSKLVSGLIQRKTEARNTELEEIATTEMTRWRGKLTPEDFDRVSSMIEKLKQAPFNEHKKDFLEQRLIDITQDNPNEDLKENYFKVSPALRADYLAVVRFSSLNGLENEWMKGDEEELQSSLEKLGFLNGRIYLQTLLLEFQKDPRNGYDYFKATNGAFDDLTQEQAGIYLRVFRKTQEAGFKSLGDSIASDAVNLFDSHGSEHTDRLINKALEAFHNTGKEIDALIFLRKH